MKHPVRTPILIAACASVALLPRLARAAYEAPYTPYLAPASYYSPITATDALTLKSQLRTRISTNFFTGNSSNNVNYGDARYALSFLDRPYGSTAPVVWGLYDGGLYSNEWDGQNGEYNREHIWAQSRLGADASNGTANIASDLFNLRAADPGVNTSKGNKNFGDPNASGANGPRGVYYYPGDAFAGEVARSMFYMATRWSQLNLATGNPADGGLSQGDLNAALRYHYRFGVSNFERRRNHLIFTNDRGPDGWSNTTPPPYPDASLYTKVYNQGNRNPYVDHPEYVWAVFGGGNNNSQITLARGTNGGSAGATSLTVNLGRVITGTPFATSNVAINKSGLHPTTYDLTPSGSASTTAAGPGQPFDYSAAARTIAVGLSGTSTAGNKSGTITIDNTDLTTGGAGQGSADANDTITVTGTTVDHATPSLTPTFATTAQTIDFGYVPQNFPNRSADFSLHNLQAPSGFTAALAVTAVSSTGATTVLSTNATPFPTLPAGTSTPLTATLTPATAGPASTVQTLSTADESIPGAAALAPLKVTLTARILPTGAASFPVTGTLHLNPGETYNTGTASISAGATLTKTGTGAFNITAQQSHGTGSALIIASGPTRLDTDAGSPTSRTLALTATGPTSSLTLNAPQHLASLTLTSAATATLTPNGHHTLVTNALSLTPDSTLDLTDNALIIDYATGTTSPLTTIASLIATASGPDNLWTGPGLTSSAARGFATHQVPGPLTALGFSESSTYLARTSSPTFLDEQIDDTSLLVRHTLLGDATLDGLLTDADLDILIANYNSTSATWSTADFNYDGQVTDTDLDLLTSASTYSSPTITLTPAALAKLSTLRAVTVAVPEPTTALTLTLLALYLTPLRPRRH